MGKGSRSQDVPTSGPVPDQSSGWSAEPAAKPKPKGIRVSWLTIIGLILLAPAVIFALVNAQKVTLNLIFTELQVPLILIILGSIALGWLCALLTSWSRRRKK
jgi:uncharacterized integral membrane protein